MKHLILFLLLFFSAPAMVNAQSGEPAATEADSTDIPETEEDTTYFEEQENDAIIYKASSDSIQVSERSFAQETLKELRSDQSLQYKEVPTVAESLWDRFLSWLNQLLEALFKGAVETNWGRVFVYLLVLIVLVVIIMMVLNVNAFKIFYRGQGAQTIKYNVLEDNIHEMDFDKLIQEAIERKDYRSGVRLVFLYALKILSDRQLVHWEQGKTNHDYVAELKVGELKYGFSELSFYFEYAWYGNFVINQEMFNSVQTIFADWKGKVK